jgi:hypothetical protein
MLSQKLLIDVCVDTFAAENRYWRHKSATKSACTAFFRPLAITSGPGRLLKLFHLKNDAPTGAGGRADLRETSIPRKAFSGKLAASDITS